MPEHDSASRTLGRRLLRRPCQDQLGGFAIRPSSLSTNPATKLIDGQYVQGPRTRSEKLSLLARSSSV